MGVVVMAVVLLTLMSIYCLLGEIGIYRVSSPGLTDHKIAV